MRVRILRRPIRRLSLPRIPRRHAGAALLIAAFVLLAVAASLRFFAGSSPRPAGAGPVGLTPSAGAAGAAAAGRAGSGSPGGASGRPAAGTSGRARATRPVVMPSHVTVAGAAALPTAHVQPGYATPEDAVDGFYLALLSGTPARACAYVTSPCPSFGSRPITGFVTVLDSISDHGAALVEITGSICVGPSCVPLVDRVMMPTGPVTFGASWTSLTSGIYGWAASPLPCVQDPATHRWHVKLA